MVQKWLRRIVRVGMISARVSIVFILLGIAANIHAVRVNGGVMPVAAVYMPPYISLDEGHVLTGPDTQSRFFVDWIAFSTPHDVPAPLTYLAELVHFPPSGYYVIASPGDVLMWVFGTTGIITAGILFCCLFISLLQKMLSFVRT